MGSTCDVEYQAKSEGHLDLQVYVPGFQALTMQPYHVYSCRIGRSAYFWTDCLLLGSWVTPSAAPLASPAYAAVA